jgi:ABC-2 type transport system ATP-binding protein
MKKKMGLALALLHDPEVLILDEPTSGLDPLATRQVQKLIRSYASSGRSVLLSTHVLDMAERQCDRVAIIARGRLVAEGPPLELRERVGEDRSLEDAFLALTREGSP